ncbi:hypothetical protein J1N35_040658 [Gossypium stocksii]|uniref:Uncharacterized protein n=1 Tax=Gossypium stocksii TaxID=47602 RepID=A0A9D3UEC3_9ROSI|nr:hypothetical protein J1N35_040658 [Gossypium stocksii]
MTTTTHESGTLRELASNFVKLDQFDGGNFRRWQKKMNFLLSTLKIAYVLDTPRLEENENESIAATRERQKWDNADYMCMGHILNGLSDEVVIPIEIGMWSHKTTNFEENADNEAMKLNLDLINEVREARKKSRKRQAFNK